MEETGMNEQTGMNKDHVVGFGIGLLAGAVIGVTIALLYAPQSGKETRSMLKSKATRVVDAVREKTISIMDAADAAASEANRRGQSAAQALRN